MVERIAVTGNIASGKSAVGEILAAKGYRVLDTDLLSHEILERSAEAARAFKQYDVFENGKISRDKLGKLVFADPELKKKLEDIIHPQVKAGIESFFNKNAGEKNAFVEIPLLFEAGMENLFDKIILVYADDKIRLERLLQRNNYTAEHAGSRMNSQLSQDEKVKMSGFVIKNNGDLADLENQVSKLLEQIRL
ncbi:MAG: dephospho-CoA kinase [Heliobacteriaceae bacterium]|jgi:dephospho-CoA kinase|nr:dephospho-CoA kinase [Heliobacteriaceae bacterium]